MGKTFRRLQWAAFIVCIALIATAFFFQFVLGLEPCPLCVLTRIAVIGLAVVYLIAALHNPDKIGQRIYGSITSILCMVGLGISIRHVWIQHLPADEVPACGPSFDYLVQTVPFTEALAVILNGSGECAKIDWTFLGGSLPTWMIFAFSGLLLMTVWAIYKNNKG